MNGMQVQQNGMQNQNMNGMQMQNQGSNWHQHLIFQMQNQDPAVLQDPIIRSFLRE